MSSLNRVQLIGNITRDIEVKSFGDSNRVGKFSIATTESYKDKSGEKKEITEFTTVEIWGNLIDIVQKYAPKGSKIYVEGSLKTDVYDKNGVKTYATKVKATSVILLGGKSEGATNSFARVNEPEETSAFVPVDDNDNLPF